ncbi:outer membrane beta-barrel protein [Foetidibacter luteolus]|uniref:outer membrane beta-barrel protein n=1 Tax=Foetidibacter luteolus TaxID=2608880 RepID=UPI00129B44E1|nr:outer membrane beta-barrel protein [Foetidibacter luteolus]
MVKKSVFLVLTVFSLFAASAQDDEKAFKFGIGGTLSFPVGDLKEASSVGAGFHLLAKYAVSENISVFAQTGVDVFKNKYIDDASTNLVHVPIMAGARFNSNGFFAGAGVGYGIWGGGGGTANGFHFSPQIGYEWEKYQVFGHYGSTKVTGGSLSYAGITFFRTF